MDDISKEVTVIESQDPFLALVERLSTNPDVDVLKLEKIVDVQMQVMKEQSRRAFNSAMVQVQNKMPTVGRDKENDNTRSWYASYEAIIKTTKEIYTKEGFSIAFYEENATAEGCIRVAASVMHSYGHTEKYHVDIPIDDSGLKGTKNKTMTHAKGSSMSYGRRYLICLIFNIATGDDDDGNAASVKYLNEAELKKIDDLIKALKVDKKKFMKFMKAESTDKILKRDFGKALTALEAKRNQSKGGKKK